MRTCAACGEQNPDHARFCLACGRPLDAAATESRRPVTTLFCDLVSSTELSERLDAEATHQVMGRYYASARTTIERHGGTVEKFVGDAVMGVFGFPRLHEDDALRAAAAALELRDAIDELNGSLERDWGVRLGTRTGIATGEVLAGTASADEPFVVGSSVNLAARLEQHAEPGQILLDGATAALIRRRAVLEPVPPAPLKGFDDPTPAFLLVRIDAAAADAAPRSAIVDRESETRLLEEAFRGAALARRCRVTNVVGDAGVGKTRLVQEFVKDLDARVLRGRCPAYGEAASFRAITEIIAESVGMGADAEPDVLQAALTASLEDATLAGRLVAAAGLTPDAMSPEERASTVRAFVTALAEDQPLALIVDDLHHASDALLDVLQHVVEWSRDAPILLLCAGRPELFFEHPSWGRLPGRMTLHLEPLGDEDGATLVRALAAGVSPEVEHRVTEIAGGNPLFIEEVAATLPDDVQALGPDDVPVPSTITALLEARVDRLAEDDRRALEMAAVLGVSFRERELEPMVGAHTAALLSNLAERDLIVRDASAGAGGWRFRHALIRDAAYHAIPKQLRAELHVAAAERLTDDLRAGFHLERAAQTLIELGSRAPGVRDTMLAGGERLAAAGRAASATGDVGSAADLLARAVALLPTDEPSRLPVLADLHHAQLYAGQIEQARSTIDELVAAFDPDDETLLAVRARMQQAHLRFLVDPASMPHAVFRGFLTDVALRFEQEGDDRDLAAALTDLALISWLEGNADAMAGSAERALLAAERSEDPRAVHEAAPLLATALLRGGVPLPDALARVVDVRERLADDRLTSGTLHLAEASMLALLDRDREAREHLQIARATFQDLGQRRWLATADEAEAEIERAAGHMTRAISLRRDVHAFFVEQGDALNALPAAAGLAELLLSDGRHDEADRLAEQVEAEDTGEDLEVRVAWMSVRAVACAIGGDADRAALLAKEALAIADATDFVLLQAEARATLMRAAPDPDDAARLYAGALARYEAKGAVQPAARLRSLEPG